MAKNQSIFTMDRKERKRLRIVGRATVKFGLVASALSLLTSSPAQANDHDVYPHGIERLSVSTEGQEADLYSAGATISSDGNKVSFFSRATNLIANDQNSVVKDVYIRDLVGDTTSIISVNSAGGQCRCQGRYSSLSADGTRVAFNSLDNQGPGHVAEDDNDKSDVYMRNIVTGKTELVSVALDGRAGNNESTHIENYSFEAPSISPDGRYVAFSSLASNLVPGDTNGRRDVFVRDLVTETTERVSVGLSAEANGDSTATNTSAISRDGRYVVFYSVATNLIASDRNGDRPDLYIYDRSLDKTSVVVRATNDAPVIQAPSVSADGRYVAFASNDSALVPNDSNEATDVFVRDLSDGSTRRVSVDSAGNQGRCEATCADAFRPAISKNGRYVGFLSGFTNLVDSDTNNQTDVFRHDLESDETVRLNISDSGEQANDRSGRYGAPVVSDGGRAVFDSRASNLVASDSNAVEDIFTNR